MKKILFILFVFLLAGCGEQKTTQEQKNTSAQTGVLATNTGEATQSGNLANSGSVETGVNIALTNTGENTTGVQNSDSEISDQISFDKEALKILFNLSGNVSNTQIVGDKVFFFDSNDGLVKYYEKGKINKLSWLRFYFYDEKYKTLDHSSNNFKISNDGKKITWTEIKYFKNKAEIKDICNEMENINYSNSKIYIANIDGSDKKLLTEIKRENVGSEIPYIQISLITGNQIYFYNYNLSCGGFLGPCNMKKLAQMDITTKEITYITNDNQCFAGITPDGNNILYEDGLEVREMKKIFLKNLQNKKVQTIDGICGISPFVLNHMSDEFFVLETSLNGNCVFDDYVDNTNKEGLVFYSKDGNQIGKKDLENSIFIGGFLTDSTIYYKLDFKYFIRNLKTGKEKEIKF